MTSPIPESVEAVLDLLTKGKYVADRSLATALFLALKLNRPLFLEGEAGVGKTEIGKVLAEALGQHLADLGSNATRGSTSHRRSTSGTTACR